MKSPKFDYAPTDGPVPAIRRGLKRGQAGKAYSPENTNRGNALRAILGRSFVDRETEFTLALWAASGGSESHRLGVGTLVAAAVKRKDGNFFRKLADVVESPQFAALVQGGGAELFKQAPDKLAVVIAAFADKRQAGFALEELRAFIELNYADADVAPEDDKTIRNRCREMGITLLAGKRGRPSKTKFGKKKS